MKSGVHTLTLMENRERPESGVYLKIFENTIFNEHPVDEALSLNVKNRKSSNSKLVPHFLTHCVHFCDIGISELS